MSTDRSGEAFRAVVQDHYRSGASDLARDFFGPALREATLYRRSVGFFTTSALLAWSAALERVAAGGLQIRLIASPEISADDLEVLRSLKDREDRTRHFAEIGDRALDLIIGFLEQPGDLQRRAQVFAWLIASGALEIRFAFPEHVRDAGMYHEKIGVINYPNGEQIAFTGSANETDSGHRRNFESIDVFRSWLEGETGRVRTKAQQFDSAWEGETHGLTVLRPSSAVLDRLRAHTSGARPPQTMAPSARSSLWPHQRDALEAFLAARSGVLEMATGTGKTRTALAILSELGGDQKIGSAVITMDGTDLLDQWAEDLSEWLRGPGRGWLLYRQYGGHREAAEFALDPQKSVLLISRSQLHRIEKAAPKLRDAGALIIHDEVHGLGAPAYVKSLGELHKSFSWRLGLSATPERAYDDEGNAFIDAVIGPTVYAFPLERAIQRGILSAFDYEPLPYELTDGDRQRLKQVYSRQASRAREGNPMSQQELWTELARVYKTAELKPEIFADYLAKDPSLIRRCIIFVETREYGEAILETLEQYTHRYRTYYAEDDRAHLVSFANGDIDCLVTCHRISQGIDIRSLNAVVLFASARSRLETIQRIGRCLRADPNNPRKRARVVDFVRTAGSAGEPSADADRAAWLDALSQVRKEGVDAD